MRFHCTMFMLCVYCATCMCVLSCASYVLEYVIIDIVWLYIQMQLISHTCFSHQLLGSDVVHMEDTCVYMYTEFEITVGYQILSVHIAQMSEHSIICADVVACGCLQPQLIAPSASGG